MFISMTGGFRICTVMVVLSLPAGSVGAQDLIGNQSGKDEAVRYEPQWSNAFKSLKRDIITLPEAVIEDSTDILVTDNNLLWLLAAAGGSIALRQGGGDERIADNFAGNSWFRDDGDFDKFVDYAGGPGCHFAFTGLWYLASSANGNEVGKKNAWTMFEALSVTGAVTLGLKLIVNDETPNGKDLAWPSGHTASSFTVAAVLDELYGPEIGIPAYIGAGLVGYRMMDSGDHWASDVLFGAVLGYIVGHHVANKYKDFDIAGFKLVPFNSYVNQKTVMGLGLVKDF